MYFVYAIGNKQEIENGDYSRSYIGVTNNPFNRWKCHTRSGYTVSKAIADNNWNFTDNMLMLYHGTEQECFDMEEKLRPIEYIGLNEASGGKGGRTTYSPERNSKISKALTGRTRSEQHKLNISKARKGSFIGAQNPRATKWKLVDPSGIEYSICGNLQQFCEENQICWAALRSNIGVAVGQISTKFRDTGNLQKRLNTIGWILFKEN